MNIIFIQLELIKLRLFPDALASKVNVWLKIKILRAMNKSRIAGLSCFIFKFIFHYHYFFLAFCKDNCSIASSSHNNQNFYNWNNKDTLATEIKEHMEYLYSNWPFFYIYISKYNIIQYNVKKRQNCHNMCAFCLVVLLKEY